MILARVFSKIYKEDGIILIDSKGQKYICGNPRKEKPITVKLIRGSDTHYIAFNRRVLPNDTIDLMMGTKISLKQGDVIKAYAPIDNSFSMIMSITEEVLG